MHGDLDPLSLQTRKNTRKNAGVVNRGKRTIKKAVTDPAIWAVMPVTTSPLTS